MARNFERQSMIRRALIISGNIIDLGFNRYNKLMPINRIIEESLKEQGFEQVVFYSRLMVYQVFPFKNGKD